MRARAIVAVSAALGSLMTAVPAEAQSSDAGLSASRALVDLGETVTLSGSLPLVPGCSAGRTVELQWHPADSSTFDTVDQAITTDDGTFAFERSPSNTGRFRAAFPGRDACPAAISNEALVRVRASVDAALVSTTPGSRCVRVSASVGPARPGEVVELQRRAAAGWTLVQRLTLDAASEVAAEQCFSFDDLGIVRLRVQWVAQDPLNETSSSTTLSFELTRATWMREIDRAIGGRSISVAVGDRDLFLYRHADRAPRIPASNEKLLLSMALLDTFGTDLRLPTFAAARSISAGGVVGDLWILGRGDPRVGRATLVSLAHRIDAAGITRVRGRVRGSTGYFLGDWDAPGWHGNAHDDINRPTALAFDGNDAPAPERRAALVLTGLLERRGIRVGGPPGAATPPSGLETIATVRSAPLEHLLTQMLRPSDNFIAEMLGKWLGVQTRGTPGTIAKGAASIQEWTDTHGVDFTLHDDSGLSYANRVTAEGLVRLLWVAEEAPWGANLRRELPTGGQGTLRDRLHGVEVRAKTGTLTDVSALSGWVFANGTDTWVEFSILSSGMPKATASEIEDEIVLILQDHLS